MSKWSEWKKAQGDTKPWHLLDTNRLVDDEKIAEKRFEICKTCPELVKLTHQCKKCGCFMKLKTKLHDAKCPIEKW